MAALAAAAALATALGACGGDDDSEKDEPAAEQTTGAQNNERRDARSDALAKSKLAEAIGGYNRGYERFFAALKRNGGDLERLQATIAEYRDVIYEFDAAIREIEFRDDLVPQVNAILENNRNLISQLDAIGQAGDFEDAQALYEEFLNDRTPQVKAINRLQDQLR
jgi:septal ring factor EnvC (AmiA/AmiB activator)